MKPRSYSDEGIVLARRNYGEADRIVSIYSKSHGRISFIAKGVRRTASRKRGHIEIFSYLKFQAVMGKGLDLLLEAEIIDNFGEVRRSLKKVALAYYFMEVVGRTTHEQESHIEVFNLILNYLNRLKKEKLLKKLRTDFVYELVTTLGFWPKGKPLSNPHEFLEEVTERQLSTVRVGKRLVE